LKLQFLFSTYENEYRGRNYLEKLLSSFRELDFPQLRLQMC